MFSSERVWCYRYSRHDKTQCLQSTSDGPWKKTAIPSSNTSCDSGCTILHLRIFHGSGTTSFCFPFGPTLVPTRTICEYTSRASGPETRITPIPPLPGGVDSAYTVVFSAGEGTT